MFKNYKSLLISGVILVLIIGLILYVFNFLNQNILFKTKVNFKINIENTGKSIQKQFDSYFFALNGLQSLFASSVLVERDEFKSYCESLDIINTYPGLLGIEYIEIVEDKNIKDFEKQVSEDKLINPIGYPNFKIISNEQKNEYAVVKYVFPDVFSSKVLGIDFYSDLARKSILEKSRDNNQSMIIGPLNLLVDNQPGFNVVFPIYKNGVALDTIESRRENLIGFVVGLTNLKYFFENAIKNSNLKEDNLNIEVFDISNNSIPEENNIIFSLNNPAGDGIEKSANLSEQFQLSVGGKQFLLIFSLEELNISVVEKVIPYIILILGIIISLLVFILIYVFSTRAERAKYLADKMTKEIKLGEEKYRATISALPDMLFYFDDKGKFLDCQGGDSDQLLMSKEVFIGKTLNEIMSPIVAEKAMQAIKKTIEIGSLQIFEYDLDLPKGKASFEMRMVRSASDRILGIARNITDKKKYEVNLKEKTSRLERINDTMMSREIKIIELKKEVENLKKSNS